jgi:dynein heavy chain
MAEPQDPRYKTLIAKVKDALNPGIGDDLRKGDRITEQLLTTSEGQEHIALIQAFLAGGNGPRYLLFLYQPQLDDEKDKDNQDTWVFSVVDPSRAEKDFSIRRRCLWASRPESSKATTAKDQTQVIQDITMGLLEPDVVEGFETIVNEVYAPLLSKQDAKKWGKNSTAEQQAFVSNVNEYTYKVSELLVAKSENLNLQSIDEHHLRQAGQASGKGGRTADANAIQEITKAVEQWLQVIERVRALGPKYLDSELNDEGLGPQDEIDRWREQLARLSLVFEQLRAVQADKATAVLRENKVAVGTRWTTAEAELNEALVEAKENVKYLTSLKPFLDVLETGTPNTIMAMVPALLNNIKMMYIISRYYSTTPRMTALFWKITNQMIIACKNSINPERKGAAIWNQTATPEKLKQLLEDLRSSLELNKVYQKAYQTIKDELATADTAGKNMELPDLKIFGHFALFTNRIDKLISVFNTVQQFTLLKTYNIDQMENLIARFDKLLTNLKSKTTDVLEIHDNNKFDTEYKIFDSAITELETSLQVTINSSFENITSTENALNLLKKFQTILQTETFKSDLDSKYMVIFHNYGLELESDQKLYEKHRQDPPMVRNITPVAGAITWSRQLLRHIKGPMDRFAVNDTVMNNPKESKKIIRTYNRLSNCLVEFEAIWFDAWKDSIESSKAGLNATLLVRNNGRLFVNFDIEILQLIKETRSIMRMGGVDVPAAAKMVLMQEAKLKTFFNELTHLVKEYERVVGRRDEQNRDKAIVSKIIPMTRDLLQPNIDALDAAIRPGEHILTWSSLNIDAFLTSVHRAISKLDAVVNKVNDIVTNRIQANLKMVSSTLLVKLQDDHFSLEQFVSVQEQHIRKQSQLMDVKNQEIQTAVNDVINTILANQDPKRSEVPTAHIAKLRERFNKLMFNSILTTTTRSLNLIKRRVGTRNRIAFMFVDKPFFDVNVQLIGVEPYVILNPSLDEVQKAINQSATAVLSCSKQMSPWKDMGENTTSFFEQIAKDKEIVKVVLLLTGGIHGLKKQVMEYLHHFKKYESLWKHDKEDEYQRFLKTNPTLEDFESKLSYYLELEREMEETPTYNIGSLSLNTEPLKAELRKKCEEWREMFANNLHVKARNRLDEIFQRFEDDERQLNQPIPDQEKLEDLRVMMNTLREVRERESEIEFIFQPVMEQYALLRRFKVAIPKEEDDRRSDLHYKWRKLRSTAEKRTDEINQLQHSFKKGLTQEVQKFGADVIAFRNDFETNGPMVEGLKPQEARERLKRYQRQFDDKERKWMTYMAGEELFGLPQHKYPELVRTKKELELLDKLYTLYMNVLTKVKGYNDILWVDLDFDKVVEEVNVFVNQCNRLPKALREWEAYKELKGILDDFANLKDLIKALKHEAVQRRHWETIMDITKHKWNLHETSFKLQDIVDANMLRVLEEVQDIASSSVREADIERRYKELVAAWRDTILTFAPFKQRGEIMLKGDDTYTIKENLEEASLAVNSMLSSRYCDFMRDDVKTLLNKFSSVSETLGLWIEVQATWMYLEAVFAGGDIMRQLPQEAKRFASIDKQWTKIMAKAHEQPNVLEFCYENELLQTLPGLKESLEECQRKLSAYLEQKRNLFPRFYFVSDTVLLEILSQASDPVSIQPHLCSIFDGIVSVHFEREPRTKAQREAGGQPHLNITDLYSESDEGGERLKLHEPIACVGPVEDWLTRLCAGMCASVREIVKASTGEILAVNNNVPHLKTVIDKYPAQVALLVLQMVWTTQVSECILNRSRNKGLVVDTSKKIEAVKNFLVRLTTSPELAAQPGRVRTNVETLITIQVHQEEVWVKPLKTVTNVTSFDWLRQARFNYKPEKDLCIVSIADSDTEYCNEYLGIKERLVITPLTDRCYITLSQALAMYMGGAPAGPAGTGKTETTKDLARTFGKFCVVFNCSDQLDRVAMGKIIRGLSQANAWGCFDEFNRIELPVLSVVAQQINCVLQALKQHKSEFTFIDGQNTLLKPGVGFFITMNPGYAGRQELPENLKILFRGVTMMVPDRRAIMKVKLASQGYEMNDVLSEKFFALYRLCEEQLSKQRHYDFGLRNILSVLRTAGAVLRKSQQDSAGHADEKFLFMRTLRDMNLSKLVYEDIDLFGALLDDIFPGINPDTAVHEEIEGELKKVMVQKGLQVWIPWFNKVIQLYETKLVRHGIMVVGPALCGKSQCFECMTDALSNTVRTHHQLRMNPKAITAPQMFGRLDSMTGDWHDGIFAAMWRKAVKASKTKNTWIICDGPVDAIWIENLNTVLDDNKLLTLANGDRIFMTNEMKLCFEVENLNNASPATVSRAGIIFISDAVLGWQPIIASRFKAQPDPTNGLIRPSDVLYPCPSTFATKLLHLFLPNGESKDSVIPKVSNFYTKECKVVMPTSVAHLSINAFHLCVALAQEAASHDVPASDELVNQIFWFSVAWSFGGMLETSDREKFDGFVRTQYKPKNMAEGTIFDYKLIVRTGEWQHWNQSVPRWDYPGDARLDFSTLFIPTMDSVRLQQLLQYNFTQAHPAMLIGVSGTAKTVTIEQFLGKARSLEGMSNLNFKKINFSSMTTPQQFYNALADMTDKSVGNEYIPAGGGQLALFIDDINMPEINEWGDQITNEIVRQLVESSEVCTLEKGQAGEKRRITHFMYVAAMSHPSGGKNDIPNRLKRHFAVFNVPLPDEVSIQQIFGTIFESRFNSNYPADVSKVAKELTKTSIDLWRRMGKKMLPTPAKFHYFFNLRDLSAIAQGLMHVGMYADPLRPDKRFESKPWEIYNDAATLVSAWRHEATRVFSDKLNTVDDKKWFDNTLHEVVGQFLGPDLASATKEPRYFCNFMRDPVLDPETDEQLEPAPKLYEPVPLETMAAKLYRRMQEHNETPIGRTRKLDLVLFEVAVKHVARISRCLSLPRGNLLMVGVGGSGKQSLTRLATYVAGYDYATVVISKGFGVNQLFDAIRANYLTAALTRPVAMVFTDNEIKQEVFLEYINSFLSNGEIPGLFAADQRDGAINEMRPLMKKDPLLRDAKGMPLFEETSDFTWKYFINRVRERLHFVLCFSPVGEKFRTRSRKFPALISSCMINWLFPWPEKALLSVSERTLKQLDMETDDKTKEGLRDLMAAIHVMMLEKSEEYLARYRREVYSTPKSYLSFIASYTRVYQEKHGEVKSAAEKIQSGLSKLQKAADDVRKLKTELQDMEVVLGQKRRETDALVKEIEVQSAEAEAKRIDVQQKKDKLEAEAAVVRAGEEEAQKDLAAAVPTLQAAIGALSSITANDFTTLKKLTSPPPLIKRIFDGVAILLHQPLNVPGAEPVKNKIWITDSWDVSGKALASDAKTLGALQNFGEHKRDYINEETCELLLPYLNMDEFNKEDAVRACGNVAGLCVWVRAMYDYINIAKVVAPKREKVRVATMKLRAANKELESQIDELNKVQAEVDRANARFRKANGDKEELEMQAKTCKDKMTSATNLIGALSGERERWTQQASEFRDIIRRLVGDVAIACAFVSYCGPFNADFRHQLLNQSFQGKCKQLRIPCSDNLNIVKFLVDETRVADWQLEGLPADSHSTQNAIMITTSSKWPLMIDPQGQALQWIRNRTKDLKSRIVQMNDKRFLTYLQEQLGDGRPFVIENLSQEIDPVIDPILEKQFVKSGRSLSIKINDQDMSYDEAFTFFMTTKLPNPSFPPELFAKCLVIDFTVTQQGLEQQLLSQVISKEKAELNEESAKLSEEINNNEKRRKDLEDRLLAHLAASQGDLLEDTKLIETLQETKDASAEIAEKLAVAIETQKRISTACEEYRPVATRGSVLYFLIVEMSNVNPMYQVSLPQFLGLFHGGIDESDKAQVTSKRIDNIIGKLTFMVFAYMVRGLFSSHKLLFVLLMACKIQLKAGKLEQAAFDAFLKGSAALTSTEKPKKPFEWISQKSWEGVIVISDQSPKAFKSVTELISRNDKAWKEWYGKEALEIEPVPDINEKLDAFDRLLLVRVLREDRSMLAATQYVAAILGKAFAEPQQLDIQACINETNGYVPIIFLLSQGSDPTTTIEAAAKKLRKKVFSISMGQGQEEAARNIVNQCWNSGEWALLQNCHLGLPFLLELEEMIRSVHQSEEKQQAINPEARIWITSEPHPKFSIGLLQMSIKLTNEPPQGIRAGIIRSYSWLSQDVLEAFRRPEWKPLLFTQCFLHSVVQERRKFGPIGFCVPYEFNQGDWAASVQFLQNHLTLIGEDVKKGQPVSWETIRYMVAEIQYGGRITDNKDRELFATIARVNFDNKITSGNHLYASGPTYKYGIPLFDEIQKHRDFVVDTYPEVDPPDAFGMSTNADITYRTRQAQEVLMTILDIQPRGMGGSGGVTREERVLQMTNSFLLEFKGNWNPDRREHLNDRKQALIVFAGQEIDRLMVTIKVIKQTCLDLDLAVAGTIIMTPKLQDALDFISDGRVPPAWVAVSSTPLPSVMSWIAEIKYRYEQLNYWAEKGRPNFYYLPGFFNPQGFLTSVRQEITRYNQKQNTGGNWALDKVELRTEVRDGEWPNPAQPPDEKRKIDGNMGEGWVAIYGLWLDGCAWSRGSKKLQESQPNVLTCKLPPMVIYAELGKERAAEATKKAPGLGGKQQGPTARYTCPVYKYPNRTDNNWIFDVELPCDEGDTHWRLRGVALLCSTA